MPSHVKSSRDDHVKTATAGSTRSSKSGDCGGPFTDNSPESNRIAQLKEMVDTDLAERALKKPTVVQRYAYAWVDGQWELQDKSTPKSDPPDRDGEYPWEYVETSEGEKQDEKNEQEDDQQREEQQNDPYAAPEVLSNGTVVDWPALTEVMDRVALGVEVKSKVWRKMRQDLSESITLANKSHPAHGSNFDKNQRPEQQIVDWATPIKGELKEKLEGYFQAKYNIYL